jgi:hypothetical protein
VLLNSGHPDNRKFRQFIRTYDSENRVTLPPFGLIRFEVRSGPATAEPRAVAHPKEAFGMSERRAKHNGMICGGV